MSKTKRASRPTPKPTCDKVCSECDYVFSVDELAAEDQALWGHPCHAELYKTEQCESFRRLLNQSPRKGP